MNETQQLASNIDKKRRQIRIGRWWSPLGVAVGVKRHNSFTNYRRMNRHLNEQQMGDCAAQTEAELQWQM